MMQTMLGTQREYRVFDVRHAELPAAVTACDAYVITGSAAGVYDDLPWIPPFLEFLRRARGRAKLVGICFGHQAMAQAFGGQVEKSTKGWSIGTHRYDVRERTPWMDGPDEFAVPASHQDQVVIAPSDAHLLASSDFTPFAALRYGDDAISFQPHPEFKHGFAAALIETRRDLYGDAAGPALLSLAGPNDCDRVGRWVGRFIDGAAEPNAAA